MNNRKVVPGAGVTHMLSTILAKVNRIEQLLSPNIENLPDSEILDSRSPPADQDVRQDTFETSQ